MSSIPQPISFGGFRISQSVYDPSQVNSTAGLCIFEGNGVVRWKFEIGDDQKLNIMFSNDAGKTYTLKMSISPN